ncbi:MAG: hypothetical protein ACI8Z1_003144 [Candidatus Azotimanducaceae bacterium]|jgi:hypothetical protein
MQSAEHHDWQKIGSPLTFQLVIEDWLGPISGIVQCQHCGEAAFAHLIGWHGKQCSVRIFALRMIPAEAYRIYAANIARDYCDLNRKQLETQALIATSEISAQLVCVDLAQRTILSVSRERHNPIAVAWQSLPEADYENWGRYL